MIVYITGTHIKTLSMHAAYNKAEIALSYLLHVSNDR